MQCRPVLIALSALLILTTLARSGVASSTSGWQRQRDMLLPRYGLTAQSSGNSIYAIGGWDGSAFLGSLEIYDGLSWRSSQPMPTPRNALASCLGTDGCIYTVGGANGVHLSTFERFTPSTENWASLPPMPTPRFWLAATAGLDGRIYAIGGINSLLVYQDVVEVYDPRTGLWSQLASLPSPRAHLAAVTGSDGRIYAIGGYDGRFLPTVDIYDPATNRWTAGPPMPTARFAIATKGPDERIYVVGGFNGSVLTTVEAYNPLNGEWDETVPDLEVARYGLAAATSRDGRVFALGGTSVYPDSLRTVETLSPVVTLSPSEVELIETGGRHVDGITCDNVPGTPRERMNRVSLRFPNLPANVTVTEASIEEQGFGTSNVGALLTESDGSLAYYPPFELNLQPQPLVTQDITPPLSRTVLAHVELSSPSTTYRVTKPIIIARPPVLLIHGIRSSGAFWRPFVNTIQRSSQDPLLPGLGIEMPCAAVNHFDLEGGCGTVEAAANRLRQRIDETLAQVRSCSRLHDSAPESQTLPDYDGYARLAQAAGRPLALAAKRVDVVAWSYGGVIARWYLSSGYPGSSAWYRRVRPSTASPGYRDDVRKLVTLGTPWRGVPLFNYANEVFLGAESKQPGHKLSGARVQKVLKPLGIRDINDALMDADNAFVFGLRTPAAEVMAVNSRWLKVLNTGVPDLSPATNPTPFLDHVAYGCVSGTDDQILVDVDPSRTLKAAGNYLVYPDPHRIIDWVQQPSWFQGLLLETRGAGDQQGYSDGVVPTWSSTVKGSCEYVPANHLSFSTNWPTITYSLRVLNSEGLPTGSTLKTLWNTSLTSSDARRTWEFGTNAMAPGPQEQMYVLVDGVGRIGGKFIGP